MIGGNIEQNFVRGCAIARRKGEIWDTVVGVFVDSSMLKVFVSSIETLGNVI